MTVPSHRLQATPPADPAGLLAALGRQLAAEEVRLEPVSEEEIVAYVDGTADEGGRLLFEERLARDASLAVMVADLAALRASLEAGERPAEAARILPFRRPEFLRRIGWAAAAAAALLAVVLLAPPRTGMPSGPGAPAAAAAPAPAAQPLFVDGFEEGSSAGWSAVASGG
jgi:anti-sigma factor RsiW